jgi:hypothetical protein
MTMRRLLAVGCTLALVAALIVPVAAQPVLLGPGALLNNTTASVAVTNTTTSTSIYSYTIPAGFTQLNFAPLHLVLLGRLTTNVGCNYGGATASIALVNGAAPPQSLTNSPVKLDLWLTGYAAQGTAINGWLEGSLTIASVAGINLNNAALFMAGTDVKTTSGAPNTLACSWMWGSAAATNSLVITNGHLVVGN